MIGLHILLLVWLLAAAAGILAIVLIRRKRLHWDGKLTVLLLVFGLILIMRMTVNLYGPYDSGTDTITRLSPLERVLDSFVHSFQTFSMDEDYTDYTGRGKELFGEAYGPSMAAAYGFCMSLLNVLAPIMGGAVLLEILTGVFPRLRLSLRPRRRKFVFSEMNRASVTLAEDLIRDKNYRRILFWEGAYKRAFHLRPLFIFTDAYPDSESEAKSELFDRVKAFGGICVRTDLQCLPLNRSKSVYYFLMDENEEKNVTAVAGLLDGDSFGRRMWPSGDESGNPRTRVYAFCRSDHDVMMINTICRADRGADDLMVRPIRDYANTVVNLLYEAPLFLPLLAEENAENHRHGKETGQKTDTGERKTGPALHVERDSAGRQGGLAADRELHVTILGDGTIAEEAFKAVFWAGQMGGVQLFIRVLAENAAGMRDRLERQCPELFAVCREAGIWKGEPNTLLRVYPKSDSNLENPPYAILEGFTDITDAGSPRHWPEGSLTDTDYWIIDLGTDGGNIFAAEQIKKELVKLSMNTGDGRHPVIAPAVFDARVAKAFAEKSPEHYAPYLIPYGTLDDRFSCRNVFMSDVTADALESDRLYDRESHLERRKDEYAHWANIMRAVHAPYKLYAMGCLTNVDLNAPASVRYRGVHRGIAPDDQAFVWMEHRRWAACLRARGFSLPTPEQHRRYFEQTGKHKDVDLLLHNCLVECSLRGKKLQGACGQDLSEFDALDLAAITAYRMTCAAKGEKETEEGLQAAEYKQYDEFCRDAAAQKLLESFSSGDPEA